VPARPTQERKGRVWWKLVKLYSTPKEDKKIPTQ